MRPLKSQNLWTLSDFWKSTFCYCIPFPKRRQMLSSPVGGRQKERVKSYRKHEEKILVRIRKLLTLFLFGCHSTRLNQFYDQVRNVFSAPTVQTRYWPGAKSSKINQAWTLLPRNILLYLKQGSFSSFPPLLYLRSYNFSVVYFCIIII